MNSLSLISVFILSCNILIAFAQQQHQVPQQQSQQSVNLPQQQHQQTLNVHQAPPSSAVQQQTHTQQAVASNSHNDGLNIKNTENGVSGSKNQNQQAVLPVVGLFSSSYRSPPSNSGGQKLSGQYVSSSQQGFTTYAGYPQQLQTYSTSVQEQQPPQLFGLSSSGDFQLSAFLGPVFWITFTVIIFILLIVLIFRSAGGFERLGGFVEDFQKPKKDGTGRAIDLDKLTAMAYTAFDQYGRWKNASYKKS